MCKTPVVQVTLYSSSQKGYVADNTYNGRVRYRVDWDAVFNGLNKKYRSAFVRVHMLGRTEIAKSSIANAVGQLSLVGLAYNTSQSLDTNGLIVGDMQFDTATTISTAETGYYMNTDTRSAAVAPMCYLPQGYTDSFVVQFTQENGSIMADANLSAYTITILFELFDEIEPQQVSMNMKGSILPMTG